MAKREKVTCGRVLPRARVASTSRSLELLPRKIALKFNFRRLKSYRAIVMPTPPPAWKGGLLPYVNYTEACHWTGYGFWSLSLNMVYARLPQPGMVSRIDIPFRFSVLSRAKVSNQQRHPYTQTLEKSSPRKPEGAGVARLFRT